MENYWDIHTHCPSGIPDREILCCQPEDFRPLPRHWYSLGIHPREVDGKITHMDAIRNGVCHPQVLAVGEIGLDKLAEAPMQEQEEAFALQLKIAAEAGKPVIIHLVRAWDRLLLLKKSVPEVTCIIHGFRGKAQLAEELVRHGFCLSFGERFQPDALRAVPHNRLFMETDESRLPIAEVYRRAAAALGIPEEKLCDTVAENVERVFFA